MSMEEKAKMVLDDLAERLPDQFDMEEVRGKVDEYTPYVMVAVQVRGHIRLLTAERQPATMAACACKAPRHRKLTKPVVK